MKFKGLQEVRSVPEAHRPYVEIPAMGDFFRKRGVFDDKLFYSQDKVTHTFVSQEREVISIHFDQNRRTIFYKGHDIHNMKLNETQLKHLECFRVALIKNDDARRFIALFDLVLHQYLREQHLDR